MARRSPVPVRLRRVPAAAEAWEGCAHPCRTERALLLMSRRFFADATGNRRVGSHGAMIIRGTGISDALPHG